MDQSTLKYLRLLIPGFIFVIGIYPIYKEYITHSDLLTALDYSSLTLIAILLGSLYYITNLQEIAVMLSLSFIRNNIKKRLISMYHPPLTKVQESKISKNRRYMHVFYNLIDNDESLKKKGANVYFNGLFLTSTADICLILFFFFSIYKFLPKISLEEYKYINTFIIIACLSVVLHICTVWKHIMLSDEQLDYIESHKSLKDSVKLKFDEIL